MSSPDRSFDNDHTITAYGDISQSEINFVPSAPSETFPTPTRQKKTYRRNAKKPLPPSIKKNLLLRVQDEDFDDDSVAKQAQKAAVSRPELDFEALVANLREFRDQLAEDRPAVPYLKLMEGRVYAPHPPRQSVEKGVEVNEEYKVEKVMVVKKKGPAKPIPSLWKSAKPPTSADKEANPPSSQKFPARLKFRRAGPLQRPPLPQWDLEDSEDSDVILEGRN
ncbi:hypothetical protein Moror_17895 [Moniliophthora roreri MCA 2997]|uniref:Uncharacterized protein n=2 Tax=Moniliophthora roreri TaxID=221103 RepID=V2YZV9_MONRO|nr:hypothetical protein Moror_17895 [Moniliophthora roreri MCA 2997]